MYNGHLAATAKPGIPGCTLHSPKPDSMTKAKALGTEGETLKGTLGVI